MKKNKSDRICEELMILNDQKFRLYQGYGFNPIQIKELFEYEKSKILYAIRAKYITADMNVAQIREVMKGIYSDYIKDADSVKVYAHKEYDHNFMRIIRVLLEWEFDPIMLEEFLSKNDFTGKEFFVFALMRNLVNDQDTESDLRFIRKCTDQVLELYDAYRPMFNARKKYTLSQILNSFGYDLYLAKVEYLATHDDKRI